MDAERPEMHSHAERGNEVYRHACSFSQRYRLRRGPSNSKLFGFGRLFGHLLEYLPEGGGRALRIALLADAGDAIDLQRIGHFGECFRAVRSDRDEQELAAASEELHLLPRPNGARPRISKTSLGSMSDPRGAVFRIAQAITRNSPSTIDRLPPTVNTAPSGEVLLRCLCQHGRPKQATAWNQSS